MNHVERKMRSNEKAAVVHNSSAVEVADAAASPKPAAVEVVISILKMDHSIKVFLDYHHLKC